MLDTLCNLTRCLHTDCLLDICLSLLFIHSAWIDAEKYLSQAFKTQKQGTSKGLSRRFTNKSLWANIIKLLYILRFIRDPYMIVTTILSVIFIGVLWYIQYITYPYRNRFLKNFKRPSILIYFLNSLIPNSLRKKL